jgi:hypothetical protein
MIADIATGAKYLPTELPQKPNLPTEPIICRRSCRKGQICQRSQIFAKGAVAEGQFADGAKYLPTEPNICQRIHRSQNICRQAFADRAAGAKYLQKEPPQEPNLVSEPQEPNLPFSRVACFIVCLFSNDICTSVPFLQTT